MKYLHMVSYILVIVGALNWGLVGLADINLVRALLGSIPMLENLVYILVGIAAIIEVLTHKKNCANCAEMMGKSMETPVAPVTPAEPMNQ